MTIHIDEGSVIYSVTKDLRFIITSATITREGTIFAFINLGDKEFSFVDIHPEFLTNGTLHLVGKL